MPALFTSTSREPSRTAASSTASSTPWGSLTSAISALTASAEPSASERQMSAAVRRAASRSRSIKTTRAPARARARAMPAPMPSAPPVTAAVRPSRLKADSSATGLPDPDRVPPFARSEGRGHADEPAGDPYRGVSPDLILVNDIVRHACEHRLQGGAEHLLGHERADAAVGAPTETHMSVWAPIE